MARFNVLRCCGIQELDRLSLCATPADALWQAGVNVNDLEPTLPKCRYIIFSQAGPKVKEELGYGYNFGLFIAENNLGDVNYTVPYGNNPNSKNDVKMWVWIPDRPKVAEWFKAEAIKRDWTSPLTIARKSVNVPPGYPPGVNYVYLGGAPQEFQADQPPARNMRRGRGLTDIYRELLGPDVAGRGFVSAGTVPTIGGFGAANPPGNLRQPDLEGTGEAGVIIPTEGL